MIGVDNSSSARKIYKGGYLMLRRFSASRWVRTAMLGLILVTAACFPVLADWSNPAGGNYANPANWNPSVLPLPTNANFTLNNTYTVNFTSDATASNAYFNALNGAVTLDLGGHTWTVGNTFNISTAVNQWTNTVLLTNGTVNVLNSGSVAVNISGAASCGGTLTLANGGMLIVTNGTMSVGGVGPGTLTVSNGGSFIVRSIQDGSNFGLGVINLYSGTNVVLSSFNFGYNTGGTGTLLIAGNSTVLVSTNTGGALIGMQGNGSVVISNGGTWLLDSGMLGYNNGNVGASILLTQAGRLISGAFNLGNTASFNTVLVSGGSVWSNGSLNIGNRSGSYSNSVWVTDPGSVLSNSGAIGVGANQANLAGNQLVVSNGAQMFSGNVTVGSGAGSASNSYFVGGGVNQASVSNGLITIGGSGGGYNTMTVTNANLTSGGLTIGNGSSNNIVTIQDASLWNFGGGAISVGSATGASSATGNVFSFKTSSSLTNIGGVGLYDQNMTWSLTNQNLAPIITGLSLGAPGLGGNSLTLSNQTVTNTTAASVIGNGSSNNVYSPF